MNRIRDASAVKLARWIREKEVTAKEVVSTCISEIQRVNPALNAVVAERFEQALKEAEKADEQVSLAAKRGEDLPPLHGVPCTIKECFSLEGMPNTSGLVSRKGIVGAGDATTVARLRAAGAIPLGVTNTSELCVWMESDNRVYGRTNNPYDTTRIVGGSSGGEGAIVGSGAVPFGLGSDLGGSIRLPAFFNGIFGHKGSGGLVPGTGQFPITEGVARRFLSTGPLCRYAEDLMPLMRILAGPDGMDVGCEPMSLGEPQDVALSELRVVNILGNSSISIHPELRKAQEFAAGFLRSEGAHLEERSFASMRHSVEIWLAMIEDTKDPMALREMIEKMSVWGLMKAWGAWLVRRSPHTMPVLTLASIEGGSAAIGSLFSNTMFSKYLEVGRQLRQDLLEAMGSCGVLLCPTYTTLAPKHLNPLLPPYNRVQTALFSVLEFAVTQVPLGLSNEGLPLGVQVVSAPGNDHLTIAVACALERAFGGWTPPQMAERVDTNERQTVR